MDDCTFDICLTGVTGTVCEHGLALATECLALGIGVTGWRAINEDCGKQKQLTVNGVFIALVNQATTLLPW